MTALLRADGTIDAGAARGSGVTIAAYDTTFGHNIPALFTGWAERQPFPWEYTVGHPLTEPYWVDTVVAGKPKRVLVQAFERRVLTYTPDNPDGWKVEAGNVGIHYRLWRGLRVPDDPKLVPL
ncbi:MAG: CAP domain-containing protein, partial [Thermomicrobiaceae bacterium]|nr:CAP domain-containing protein [Thermomicrobiaceae bacterium]